MDDRDLDEQLRARFGLEGFRPWQREAIDATLEVGSRVLVVAPTGGGKSLTYQFPAAVLPGTTLVISPLVALMEDQVRALEARGIPATFLASTLESDVRYAREVGMRQGRYKLVYIAPERLAYDGFVEQIGRLSVPLIAIDEAHCIAQWGHDFRPDYLRIGTLLERIRPPRVLACTATATPEVRREIRTHLGFDRTPGAREVLRGFARPNLHLSARAVEGPTEARKRVEQELSRALGSPARPTGAGIVYAATRKQTEIYAESLRHRGWNVAAYHAGMEPDVRTRAADRFARREVDVVVATNAFGMGIDRSDIRTVLHAQPPASIEAYYQEVGRAGRDGAEASGVLLCSGMDIALRRRLCQLGSDGAPAPPALAARSWRLFRDLLRYLDAGTCRHDFVLRYFGDERELLGGCGHCDVCADLDGADDDNDDRRVETTEIVRKALSGVARAKGRAGLTAIAEMLRGVRNARTEKFGFTTLSTFGLLSGRSDEWVMTVLRGTIAAGWVDLTPTEHPVPLVTKSGWEALTGKDALRFRLPRVVRGKKSSESGTARSGMAQSSTPKPVAGVDEALFERLRAHRASVAKTRGVPPYVIAFDRTLQEIAARRPTRIEQLPDIYGLGPARIEAFGEGFLKVVRGS